MTGHILSPLCVPVLFSPCVALQSVSVSICVCAITCEKVVVCVCVLMVLYVCMSVSLITSEFPSRPRR